jgi:hypothetical protein
MEKGVRAGFLIAGAGLGAGCMFLMDPDRGRRRRVLLRDKTAGAYRDVRSSLEKAQTDLANRAHGVLARVKSAVEHEPVEEAQLTARVRTKLGRLVSHPHAIDVVVRDGAITLSGAVLEYEAQELVSGVGTIRGVKSVCDHLVRHRDAAGIPSLQGGREHSAGAADFLRREWPPALRVLAGVAGASLGLGLIARGISDGKRRVFTP